MGVGRTDSVLNSGRTHLELTHLELTVYPDAGFFTAPTFFDSGISGTSPCKDGSEQRWVTLEQVLFKTLSEGVGFNPTSHVPIAPRSHVPNDRDPREVHGVMRKVNAQDVLQGCNTINTKFNSCQLK